MPLPSDLLCARIVVQRGACSEEQVRECLDLQAKNRAVGYDEALHAVLLKRGWIGEEDAKKVERDLALALFVRGERLFARICVERGLLTQDAAKEALQKQKEDGYNQRVGDMLLARAALDRSQRDEIAALVVRRTEEEEAQARRSEAESAASPSPPEPSAPPVVTAATGEEPLAPAGSFRKADAALAAFRRDQRRYSSAVIDIPPAPGMQIEGYELLQRLGQGTVGVVWKARPSLGGPLVAIKVLSPSLTGNADLLAKFHKAFERASGIDHANLARLGQVARSGELTYYTMEYVEGESLADRVERGGPLPAARAREVAREVARALAHVHAQRVLHGGIRPRNVLLAKDGRVRLTDLIIGRLAPRLGAQPGDADDPRLYLSPEELTASAGPDPRDDVYAFGLVLYYALAGKHAFPDSQPMPRLEGPRDPREADPRADAELSAIVVRATQPSREQRYRDANEILSEIDPHRGISERLSPVPMTPASPLLDGSGESSVLVRGEATMGEAPAGFGSLPGGVLATPAPSGEATSPDVAERTMAVPPPRGARMSPSAFAGPDTPPLRADTPPLPSKLTPVMPRRAAEDPGEEARGRPRRRSMAPLAGDAADLTGKVINNRYRIVSKLGEGGMGVVYKAEHTVMSKTIAFKVLHSSLVKSEESIARFQREVLAMAQFAHRNVVRIYDAGKTEDGRFYIAMEFVEGKDLASVLETEGALAPARAIAILRQTIRAIAEGHAKGIVHRDLKPENILLSGKTAEDETVKVMDFGIAKIIEAEGGRAPADGEAVNAFRTLDRVVLGTPEYMSPEQASGSVVDHRSDLYSLGVIAYEVLLGRLPFDADSPVGFIGKHIVDPPLAFEEAKPGHGLAASIEAFVMKALEKDPDERFQSADEMLKALEVAAPDEVKAAVDLSNRLKATRPKTPSPLETPPRRPSPAPTATTESGKKAGKQDESGKKAGKENESAKKARPAHPKATRMSTRVAPAASEKKPVVMVAAAAAALAVFLGVSIGIGIKVFGKGPIEKRLALAKQASDPALASGSFEDAKKPFKLLLEGASDSERAKIEEELGRIAAREREADAAALRKKDFDEAVAKAQRLLATDEAASEAPLQEAIDKAKARKGETDASTIAALETKQQAWKMRKEEKLGERLAKDPMNYDSALDHLRAALQHAVEKDDRARLDGRIADLEGDRHVREAGRLLADGRFDEARAEATKAIQLRSTDERKSLLDEIEKQRAQAELATRRKRIEAEIADADGLDAKEHFDDARRRYESALAEARRPPAIEASAKTLEEKLRALARKVEALDAFGKLPALPGMDATEAAVREAIDRRRDYAKNFPESPRRQRALDEADEVEKSRAGSAEGKARAERQTAIEAARAALASEDEKAAREALARAKAAQEKLPAAEAEVVKKLEEEIESRFALARLLRKDFALVPKGKRPAGWKGDELNSFYVGRTEVTNSDYWKFCNDVARKGGKPRWPEGWEADGDARIFPAGKASFPVVRVSFEDAQAYCEWLTANAPPASKLRYRLPHEVEWERAARGDDGRRWPWGDEWKDDKARWWKQEDGKETEGAAPESESVWARGASPFGAIHMAGNVAEWVDDPFEDESGNKVAGTKALKGGSFRSPRPELLQATGATSRKKAEPADRFDDAGFRVIAEIVKE